MRFWVWQGRRGVAEGGGQSECIKPIQASAAVSLDAVEVEADVLVAVGGCGGGAKMRQEQREPHMTWYSDKVVPTGASPLLPALSSVSHAAHRVCLPHAKRGAAGRGAGRARAAHLGGGRTSRAAQGAGRRACCAPLRPRCGKTAGSGVGVCMGWGWGWADVRRRTCGACVQQAVRVAQQ